MSYIYKAITCTMSTEGFQGSNMRYIYIYIYVEGLSRKGVMWDMSFAFVERKRKRACYSVDSKFISIANYICYQSISNRDWTRLSVRIGIRSIEWSLHRFVVGTFLVSFFIRLCGVPSRRAPRNLFQYSSCSFFSLFHRLEGRLSETGLKLQERFHELTISAKTPPRL